MTKRLIVISGPTAIGKTQLSINLAKHLSTEIISADSRQFYKELKIGAAPPSQEELLEVKHHFVQHLSVEKDYNFGQFAQDALQKINELFEQNDYIIMVGGSGLYINAVIHGLDEFPEVNPKIKQKIIEQYQQEGIGFLQKEIEKRDPVYFQQVDQQNPQRLIRALSVILSSNQPFSIFRKGGTANHHFDVLHFSLLMDRPVLYEKINKRVEEMIRFGLEQEARSVLQYKDRNALKTVGYQEFFAFFEGKITLQETISKIQQNTRRFAKRQITWFKRDKEAVFIPTEGAIERIIELL